MGGIRKEHSSTELTSPRDVIHLSYHECLDRPHHRAGKEGAGQKGQGGGRHDGCIGQGTQQPVTTAADLLKELDTLMGDEDLRIDTRP